MTINYCPAVVLESNCRNGAFRCCYEGDVGCLESANEINEQMYFYPMVTRGNWERLRVFRCRSHDLPITGLSETHES